jgi:hypothetical protein
VSVYAGLCGSCLNMRSIESRRGSRFVLCERSRSDPRFPKYPPLPVLTCVGYEPALDTGAAQNDPVGRRDRTHGGTSE